MGRVILSILFVMVSYAAHASELPSIFQPEPQPTVQPSPSASPQPVEPQDKIPIYCFQSALQLGLTFHQSILLCTNAKTLEPIRCIRLRFNQITPDQRVSLCQGATSEAPSKCFDESFDLLLSYDQQIKLCNGASFVNSSSSSTVEATAPVSCFRKAISLPLSQDQRVILCANADSDTPVQCFKSADYLQLTFDQRVRLCTQLTPSSW